MAKTQRPGTVLQCEEGSALVIAPGTTALDALLTLLEDQYGGERFESTNPVVLEHVDEVHISTWRSYLKQQREDEGVDFEDYWGPDGQGKRSITVAYFSGDVYLLGDLANAAEMAGASRG